MLVKYKELEKLNTKDISFYLFYGINSGLIEETIDKIFKPNFPKNITNYDEVDLLKNVQGFKEIIFNKSFFDDEKFIIINRASNKILEIIQEIIEANLQDLKIIIKTGILEKKSKLRSYFEKNKSTVITPFYEDSRQSIALIVQNFFKEKKINISNEIINLIVERSKGNRIYINNELEKISLYTKNSNKISLGDILKLTNLTENFNISELVDQSLSKNKKKTINILNENSINTEENILVIRTFLSKLKRLEKLKIEFEKNKNIDQVLSSSRPPIFWKDNDVIKQQLKIWSLNEIRNLMTKVNDLELTLKKNNQITNQILNNFILENFTINKISSVI